MLFHVLLTLLLLCQSRGLHMNVRIKLLSKRCNTLLISILGLIMFQFPFASMAESDVYEETISAGNKTYYRFCSVCHGKNAMGGGPYSENLKISPPDLTKLTTNNNGVFPWIKVYQVIDGKNMSVAHGTSEMPVWGELFDISNWDKKYIEHSDVITRGRIFELLVYLNFIQQEN